MKKVILQEKSENKYCNNFLIDEENLDELEIENLDSDSVEILRKLTFLQLIDASKECYLEKINGKNFSKFENKKNLVSKLYSNYKRIKACSTFK